MNRDATERRPQRVQTRDRWWAVAAVLTAFAVRALPVGQVFYRGQGVFEPFDAMYHVRRAFYTFENWPREGSGSLCKPLECNVGAPGRAGVSLARGDRRKRS